MVLPTNSTGWAELFNGELINAAYTLYLTAWGPWFMLILMIVTDMTLYLKTRSHMLSSVILLLFGGIFVLPANITGNFLGWTFYGLYGLMVFIHVGIAVYEGVFSK